MTTKNHQLGRLLEDRYRIDALLGVGSSASVYLAYDTRLERQVAAKLLHPGLATDDAFVRRFSSEARSVAALNHPNIVHVYDWGEESDGPFLILEYLAGGSLKDLLSTQNIDIAQVTAIGADAAGALAFAHRQGIIHRDVKPANLLFDEHGSVHVADFGLARTIASVTWTEPTGVVLGTAMYASPEQALGHSLNGESDVYSLALVLYEALVGTAPFVGETPLATLMNRVDKPLPTNSKLGPLMPLLEAATTPDPKNRTSAADFVSSLQRLRTTLPPGQPLSLITSMMPIEHSIAGTDEEAIATVVEAREKMNRTVSYGVASPVPIETKRSRMQSAVSSVVHRSRFHRSGDSADHRSRHSHHHRKRYRWVVGCIALLILIAVGAAAISRYVVYDHAVPKLVGIQLLAAQKTTKTHGLRIRVVARTFSTVVPAGVVISQSPNSGLHEQSGSTVRVVVSQGPKPVAVPKVVGKSKAIATRTLTRSHLVPVVSTAYNETVPTGEVVSISPASGNVPYASKVSVVVSEGPSPCTIPQFSNAPYGDVEAQLSALRLTPMERMAYSNDVSEGIVISTNPPEGTGGVLVGSRVVVTVSKGPRLVAVPTVAGDPISQAVTELQQSGLVVNEQIGPPFATTATTTDPPPGTAVRIGTAVTLYVA